MRAVLLLLILILSAPAVYYGAPLTESALAWLAIHVADQQLSPSWGVTASFVASAMSFFYVIVTQNLSKDGEIRRYRWAEEKLIQLGKMKQEEILAYHRSYNWHSYAGLGFAIVFIIVPIFISNEYDQLDGERRAVVVIGLSLIGIATVLLGAVDLFHTNSLTPLITADRRFVLMDLILKLGWTAMLLQICALGVFLAIISSYLSFVTSALGLIVMVLITNIRGVPLRSVIRERRLSEAEAIQVDEAG